VGVESNQYWLYRHHTNILSLLKAVSSARLSPNFQISFQFLVSQKNLYYVLKEWHPENYVLEIVEQHSNMVVYNVTKIRRKEELDPYKGTFNIARIENSDIYVVITLENQEFMNNVLVPLFDNVYVDLSRLHLSSRQIREVLEIIKKKSECNIVTDRVLSNRMNKRFRDPSNKETYRVLGKKPRFKESDIRWTEEEYHVTFQRAAENDEWIDKIAFSAVKDQKLLFSAAISRSGLFRCDQYAEKFYGLVVEYLINTGVKNIKLYSNRSRVDNNGKISPIAIEYHNNVFENVEQNKKLIKAMSEFPKSSYSVYHGNPYLHMSIVDYADGSSYDLWVVSDTQLIIIPQLKATFNSLSRICEHIFQKFAEGKIVEVGTQNE
jgi:hypothetical protein